MSKVKHIVLLKFKDGTNEEQIAKCFDDLLELTENIPGIDDYVSGANMSAESLNQGYTHALIMTFPDAAARDTYVSHPDHTNFVAAVMPMIESVCVVDFEV